jgi:hypothetical protein
VLSQKRRGDLRCRVHTQKVCGRYRDLPAWAGTCPY